MTDKTDCGFSPLSEKALAYAISQCADVSHGEGHIRRVIKNAMALANSYPEADRQLLFIAAALHDCGQREQIENKGLHHASVGADKARAWLLSQGCRPDFADGVSRTIAAHSSPELAAKEGLEAKLLFDADKLDMVGAVGLSRALMYALDENEPLYSPSGESFYSVAQSDLEFVKRSLFTPEARRMADDRMKISESFLQSLKTETN